MITYRRATPEDVRPALDLVERVWIDFNLADNEPVALETMRSDITQNKDIAEKYASGRATMFVATDEDNIVGVVGWCLNNVAKGIARDELPYVMEMYNHYVRDMLNGMVEWFIGSQTNFSVSAGKMGKYFKRYLPPELYAQYAATYSGSDFTDIWASVDAICDLFHTLAVDVSTHFGFTYRQNEGNGIREYLRMVREHVM